MADKRTLRIEGRGPQGKVRRFRLAPLRDGKSAGEPWQSSGDRCAVGSDPLNDLVVEDLTVSRFHCEVRLGPEMQRNPIHRPRPALPGSGPSNPGPGHGLESVR